MHTEAEFAGAGIGLVTAQRIVHRHGDRVWAEGKAEEGATFYFTSQVTLTLQWRPFGKSGPHATYLEVSTAMDGEGLTNQPAQLSKVAEISILMLTLQI